MITQIELQNFKCFKDKTSFPLSKLNLLTGINGRGKSTLLQSLLLFKQSIERDSSTPDKLYLNGDCVELGTFDDFKNSETPKNTNVMMCFFSENHREEYHLSENFSDDLVADIENMRIYPKTTIYSVFSRHSHYHYIAADRLGPLKYHEKVSLGNFINVGSRGEFTINVLAKLEDESVNDKLYLGKDAQTLVQQAEEWLSYIFDGAKIELKGKERESSVYYILFNTKKTGKRYKPSNIGFGYNYILPIIVSGLIAKEGETLIVENPEAHLHPRAQSRIAEFLSKVASCGVQVIIESHSEHILNGIRIASLRDDIEIKNSDVSILYFQDSADDPFIRLNLKEEGKIDNWVEGFFDQQEIDLAKIFRLGRVKR